VSLAELNGADEEAARAILADCCVSRRWIDAMLGYRPYADGEALLDAARTSWANLGEDDWLEAFAGHPRIGDVASLRQKYASSAALAAAEQSGVAGADDALLERLAEGNRAYEERHGFIFIVCATGRSAAEMLALLESRIDNSRDEELRSAAREQLAILLLRLEKLL
jgi:2-oxo-4-hydroxy-4-carboxy-5-ureidoimidazoline decarboxylase